MLSGKIRIFFILFWSLQQYFFNRKCQEKSVKPVTNDLFTFLVSINILVMTVIVQQMPPLLTQYYSIKKTKMG